MDCAEGGGKPARRHHCSLAFQGAGLGFAAVQSLLCGFLDISSASRTQERATALAVGGCREAGWEGDIVQPLPA